ncbi:carbon-nitrogen hydrolase family protein [Bacteriovorax sp. DB6_IX]|uniref:carbon-nitrogen hydrolase family protein n=1 Tax=Bacteriovorax sp. DB6_IX TaxID=1353530 RepID=UPI00038A03B9|nr:carbon-nitrogen hydrolase family protein [Bacteriovorax sp. DB6_IX]EQC51797.1 hydrolase, carbon-nitrogen family [Bacteriovorax sp. DB6_IX]
MAEKQKDIIEIRNATIDDMKEIIDVVEVAYGDLGTYSEDMLRGQITNFPEGCFVVTKNKKIIAYSASLIISEKKALGKHTWNQITAGGFASTHDDDGEYLYGYETCVVPGLRGLRIGQRIYNARKRLVQFYQLKGIVFAGRIPNFHKKKGKVQGVEEYVEKVKTKEISDPTLGFHLRRGFEIIGVLKNYLPQDYASMGYGVHLKWDNPEYKAVFTEKDKPFRQNSVRIVCVQYKQRAVESFEEFAKIVEYYVDVAGDYKADFLLFPELFTMQLLSIENEEVAPDIAIKHMTKYTERIKDLFHKLSIAYNVNIIAGSHPTEVEGSIRNISYICLRDGRIHEQSKIHPTPDERYWWKIEGGEQVKVIDTDCGPIGVLICYDSEFPELTRHLVNQGMQILFVPFLTDNRQGYCRVRYCSQARAIENQIYVAMAGNVGNLPRVKNLDIQYAQSAIFTPCDFSFAKDGIAAEATPNVEMVTIADVRTDVLLEARSHGAVQNLKDRRHDLYSVKWHK